MALSLESSPFAKFWIRKFLKPRVQPKKPKVPKHKSIRPSHMKRSISAPLLATIDEEDEEGIGEADVEDNEHGLPDSSSDTEAKDGRADSSLTVTRKAVAPMPTRAPSSTPTSNIRQEMKLISKRVSDLEGSLAFAQEQIQKRDERLFECQQSTAEDIDQGMSEGLDRQRMAWETHHASRLRSNNEQIQGLQSKIAQFEHDLKEKDSLIQKLSESRIRTSIMEAEKDKGKQETILRADIIRDGPNSFLRLL